MLVTVTAPVFCRLGPESLRGLGEDGQDPLRGGDEGWGLPAW